MTLDKDKIETALLKQGLSTKRSKTLADKLVKEDLVKEEEVKPLKKKKKEVTYKNINEVLKED